MNTLQTPMSNHTARDIAAQAGQAVDQAATAAVQLADTAKADIDHVLATAPSAIKDAVQRSIGDAEALARRGIERARDASAIVSKQVSRAGERTVTYIQDEPVKSVLIAAAVGAASAALIGWVARHRAAR